MLYSIQRTCTVMICLLFFAACTPLHAPMDQRVAAISGRTLSGKAIDSTFFRDKITLLNFMLIGCPPCMKEVNTLNWLHRQYKGRAFQVLCIPANTALQLKMFNSNRLSEFSDIKAYFKTEIMEYEILPDCDRKAQRSPEALAKDSSVPIPECGHFSALFKTDGYPQSYLINENGSIVKSYKGVSLSDPDSIIARDMKANIDSLLYNVEMQMHYSTLYRFLPPKKP